MITFLYPSAVDNKYHIAYLTGLASRLTQDIASIPPSMYTLLGAGTAFGILGVGICCPADIIKLKHFLQLIFMTFQKNYSIMAV
jgi:hypothetical protein